MMIAIANQFHSATVFLFQKIAEPRVIRIVHFAIYTGMFMAGFGTITEIPPRLENASGLASVYMIGIFLMVGAFTAGIAVLPGVWWLERAGLFALIAGVLMYIVVLLSTDASLVSFAVSVTFILRFSLRWVEIRKFQLAPRKD